MDRPLVVVGDSMLDVDIEGTATRLSPEAPVPVVDAERVWHRPGGAGLAAVLAARTGQDAEDRYCARPASSAADAP